jgi:hypothetical protein
MPYEVNYPFKEVYFHKYCKTCEYEKVSEVHEPCNECMDTPINLHSHKPVNYKEKQD